MGGYLSDREDIVVQVNIPHLNAFLSSETIRTYLECAPALGAFFANTEQISRAMTIWRYLDSATMAQTKTARKALAMKPEV
jgi:hypothetical protein